MLEPTATDLALWSLVDFSSLGFSNPARLQVYIDRATAEIVNLTGRDLLSLNMTDDPNLIPLMQQAIQIRTEMLVHQAQPDYVDTLSDFDLIGSFTAGPYSEQRRSPGEAVQARTLSQNPVLHELLFNLLTDDKYDDYLLWVQGQFLPALMFTTLDMGDIVDYVYPRQPNLFPYVEP